MDVYDNFRGCPFEHFEMMNCDLARFQFNLFTLARHFVRFSALNLNSRIRRRRLFDFTDECFQHFFELLFCHINRLIGWGYFAICIECISSSTQPPYQVPTAAITMVRTEVPSEAINPNARATGAPHNRGTIKSRRA